MKLTTSTLRLILPAAAGLLAVSCGKDKVANNNPYQDNPYYGPQSSTYGTDTAAPTAPAAPAAPASNYPTYTDNSYTPPAPAAPAAPAYNDTYAANSYSGGGTSHTVQKGDTLYGLSRRYGTSVTAIQSANGISGTTIGLGQTLQIPQG
ncbi:MAG: LysM peptidoglycan-binding domain-containing protein [Verrucomicrobiales bacterium]